MAMDGQGTTHNSNDRNNLSCTKIEVLHSIHEWCVLSSEWCELIMETESNRNDDEQTSIRLHSRFVQNDYFFFEWNQFVVQIAEVTTDTQLQCEMNVLFLTPGASDAMSARCKYTFQLIFGDDDDNHSDWDWNLALDVSAQWYQYMHIIHTIQHMVGMKLPLVESIVRASYFVILLFCERGNKNCQLHKQGRWFVVIMSNPQRQESPLQIPSLDSASNGRRQEEYVYVRIHIIYLYLYIYIHRNVWTKKQFMMIEY